MKIVVVGAGIMGLASAWALARDGHEVAVYDQGKVPNPAGASVDEHRLIRHPYGAERGYTRMVDQAYAAWDRLWADLGASHYAATGTLILDHGDPWSADSERTLAAENIPFRRLGPRGVVDTYPMMIAEGLRGALALDSGGALLARRIVAALAAYLPTRGVTIESHTQVRGVDPERGRAMLDDGRTVAGDLLIVAAGPWAPRLLPRSLRGRVTPSRQAVIYLTPPADLTAAWIRHPMVLDLDLTSGFYLVPPRPVFGGGFTRLKVGDHGFTRNGDPDADRAPRGEETHRLLGLCARWIRDFERYAIQEAKICFYDVEAQERFIVERIGGRGWAMSGFSGHGFKFGAVLALELARTIRGERAEQDLTDWAAGRLVEVQDKEDAS